jgi:ATP-dependent 26S proteasome regulatory subunit
MPQATATQNPKERLKIIIDSSTPLVIMETLEEARAMAMIRSAASELQLPVFEWTIATGLLRSGASGPSTGAIASDSQSREMTEMDRKLAAVNVSLVEASLPPLSIVTGKEQFEKNNEPPPIYNTKEPEQVLAHLEAINLEAVFVLKDLHRHLDNPVVVRLVRDIAHRFSRDRRTLILISPSIVVPAEWQNDIEYLSLPLPDLARLKEIVNEQFKRLSANHKLQNKLDGAGLDAVAANLSGLTEEEAERACAQAMIARYGITTDTVTDVLQSKREILRRSQMLDFREARENLSAVGGLDNLKKWLHKRCEAFGPSARAAGLEPPKGLILLGVQGCGKSICAQAIAGEWKLPLVKFDSSAVFDKYIGETEKRIKKLFQIAERLAPCILWIDELEKVFAGSGADSASSDAGTSSRVLGAFLSWMQDRTAPIFVAATCNNVTALPPELIRKGRFDEIFFVDLPNSAERRAILQVQLARRKYDCAKFDLDSIVSASKGYSGAEIDAAIQSAMYSCFADKKPMSTAVLMAELADTVPLSATRAEDIERLRAWAKLRAVPASLPEALSAAAE